MYEFIQRCSQNLFYFNVSYWIPSQAFCSNIVYLSRHKLCVKQDFQFADSSSDSVLPRQVHLVKVTTPLDALGLIFRLSISNYRQFTIQYSNIFFQYLFLVLSILPGCAQSVYFFCLYCVHILKLFLFQSFPLLLYLPYVPSNWFSIFFSMATFKAFSFLLFLLSLSLLSLTMFYIRAYILLFLRFLLNFWLSSWPICRRWFACVLAKTDEKEVTAQLCL